MLTAMTLLMVSKIMGPHQMFGNITRSIEFAVTWVSTLLRFCNERGITHVEAREENVDVSYQLPWSGKAQADLIFATGMDAACS